MTEAQLRAFVAVAESGSFRDAAQRLHMSQPGVSRALSALEHELGGALVVRGHGRVSLTALGERALLRSRTLLREAEAMRHDRDELDGIAGGHVRLGSMPSVSSTILPPLLAGLARRHPALSVTVIDGHDDELVAWVRDGTVELAVVAGEHPDLSLYPLATDELLAVLPATHPLTARSRVTARDLACEPFILTRAGCERMILATLTAHGIAPSVTHEVTEASSILALVSQGLGISIMPGLAAKDPPVNVELRPLKPRAQRRLSLATTPTGAPSPPVQAILAASAAASHPL